MPRKRHQRISVQELNGTVSLDMGAIEIWDGADLALLRETVARLTEQEQKKSLSFAMTHVKYVPSGFFGMLLDCYDRGIRIQLVCPTHYVTGMLWFQRFFAKSSQEAYQLHSGPEENIPHDQPLPWASDKDQEIWDANQTQVRPMATSQHRS
ncbi:MAG: hypothetical protein JKY95_12750 [Planctomycetaceae bacterium]|nr:hypothetical protein [Planctomycetaceae bacterium]